MCRVWRKPCRQCQHVDVLEIEPRTKTTSFDRQERRTCEEGTEPEVEWTTAHRRIYQFFRLIGPPLDQIQPQRLDDMTISLQRRAILSRLLGTRSIPQYEDGSLRFRSYPNVAAITSSVINASLLELVLVMNRSRNNAAGFRHHQGYRRRLCTRRYCK